MRHSEFAPVITALFIALSTSLCAADGFEEKIRKLNQAAQGFRDSGDFEEVEKLRRERWALIRRHAEGGEHSGSPWIAAYRAIELVDGSEGGTADAVATGLLNELKYKEACDTLLAAFHSMQASTEGSLLGELAVRLFEVAQQAQGVYYDALEPSSPRRVADKERIIQALTAAREHDPCCVLATPMLHYLTPPDPQEAFLRAEVRPAFKQRQKELVDISHPLVINEDAPANGGAPAKNKPARNEHADVAVMPWHAPVEIDKARSLQNLIDDLDYTYPLLPDLLITKDYFFGGKPHPLPSYVIPGAIFQGIDAQSQPLMLVFGQVFFGRKIDETGRLRTAAYFQDRGIAQSKKRLWDHQYLEVLWRVPTDEELSRDSTLRQRHELVSRHPVRRKFLLGTQEFYIYDFPVRDTERFIELGIQVVCFRDIGRLEKLTFTPTGNRPDAVSKLLSKPEALEGSPFSTSPLVQLHLSYLESRSDPTKHPLIELTRPTELDPTGWNPLVIVSEKNAKDKDHSGPSLWPAVTPEGFPFVKLENGTKLYVAVNGRPEAPCCWIDFPGATAFMPLTPRAIPRGLLLGSKQGRACVSLLNDAGYSNEDAAREILACMEKKNSYVPPKFKTLLDARVNAIIKKIKARTDKQRLRASDPSPVERQQLSWAVFGEMLEEKGWQGSWSLADSMHEAFRSHGFRYLRDKRGNWIMPRSLIEGEAQNEKLDDYPFAYLAPDGEKSIETSQIYSWTNYQQIKRNIFGEHLRKALAFHPCLAILEAIAQNDATELLHPEERKPKYLKDSVKRLTQQQDQGRNTSNQPTENRAVHLLDAPIAAWAAGNDIAQQESLKNLFNAYVSLVIDYADSGVEATRLANIIRWIDSYLYIFAADNEFFQLLLSLEARLTNDLRKAIEKDRLVQDTVLGVQLSSARDYAKRRYFHKAITYYNDLISQLKTDMALRPQLELFSSIPTTETANDFIGDVEQAVAGQWLLINLQTELAGVLNAAGLTTSAQFIWQRTIDEYEFFLEPATGVAQGLLESYGLRPSPRLKTVGRRLEDAVNECRGAIERYCGDLDWRQGVVAGGDEHTGRDSSESVAKLRGLLEQDNAGLLDDESQASIEHTLANLTKQCVLTFRDWLDLKQLLLELRPALAKVPFGSSTPLAGCPHQYIADPEEGFCDQIDKFLQETRPNEVLEWCKTPIEAANRDGSAARISFLLAWYFSDSGRVPEVRAALVNVARVESAHAKTAGTPLERLVHERNAFSAIVEAGENTQIFPGFSAFKSDFSQLLQGQLGDWEKRWFASGNYGPHASEFRYDLEARGRVIRNDLSRLSREWRRDRWFFTDYTFKFGSLPDYLVVKLMNTPELFRELTPEEVNKLGVEAVEGKRWALLTEEAADKFLKDFHLDDTLKKEILYLKP